MANWNDPSPPPDNDEWLRQNAVLLGVIIAAIFLTLLIAGL